MQIFLFVQRFPFKGHSFSVTSCLPGPTSVFLQIKVEALDNDPRKASARLRDFAFLQGSMDNISVMVIRFLHYDITHTANPDSSESASSRAQQRRHDRMSSRGSSSTPVVFHPHSHSRSDADIPGHGSPAPDLLMAPSGGSLPGSMPSPAMATQEDEVVGRKGNGNGSGVGLLSESGLAVDRGPVHHHHIIGMNSGENANTLQPSHFSL